MIERQSITLHDVHPVQKFYGRFLNSLSEEIREVVICSPYFDILPPPFPSIVELCTFLLGRGTEKIKIITRPPGHEAKALPLETAKRLAGNGVDIFVRTAPYLHAKIYHIEYAKGHFRSFIGSSNFTSAGLEKNFELMAEIQGTGTRSACHREIADMTNNGGHTFHSWMANDLPQGEPEPI